MPELQRFPPVAFPVASSTRSHPGSHPAHQGSRRMHVTVDHADRPVLVVRTSPIVCGVFLGYIRDRHFVRVHADDLNRQPSQGSTVVDKRCRSKDHFGSARSVDIGRFARRHDTSIRPRRPADTIAATKSVSHSDLAPRVPTLVPGCFPGSQACSRLPKSYLTGIFCLCFRAHLDASVGPIPVENDRGEGRERLPHPTVGGRRRRTGCDATRVP